MRCKSFHHACLLVCVWFGWCGHRVGSLLFFFFNREALLDEMREWSCGDAACEESSFLVAHGGGSVDDVVGTFC